MLKEMRLCKTTKHGKTQHHGASKGLAAEPLLRPAPRTSTAGSPASPPKPGPTMEQYTHLKVCTTTALFYQTTAVFLLPSLRLTSLPASFCSVPPFPSWKPSFWCGRLLHTRQLPVSEAGHPLFLTWTQWELFLGGTIRTFQSYYLGL